MLFCNTTTVDQGVTERLLQGPFNTQPQLSYLLKRNGIGTSEAKLAITEPLACPPRCCSTFVSLLAGAHRSLSPLNDPRSRKRGPYANRGPAACASVGPPRADPPCVLMGDAPTHDFVMAQKDVQAWGSGSAYALLGLPPAPYCGPYDC